MSRGSRREADYEQATPLAQIVGDVVRRDEDSPAGRTSAATRAWCRANGTLEERHTVGTFLRQADGEPTALIVYIDSNALLHDFTTKREMYRDRLANIGFEVDEVQFRLSRYRKAARPEGIIPTPAPDQPSAPLPELDASQLDEIGRQTAGLPQGLRTAVSDAMISFKRRSMAEEGGNG